MQMETPTPAGKNFIRRATFAEIDGILAVQRAAPECAQWTRADYEEVLATSAILTVPEPQSFSPRHVVLCALQGDTVVGFAVGSRLRFAETVDCELENMAVLPTHRRCGVGRDMVQALLVWSREHGGPQRAMQLMLEARASNTAALELYHKMGFLPVGRRREYYSQPTDDAILMAWFPAAKQPQNGEPHF